MLEMSIQSLIIILLISFIIGLITGVSLARTPRDVYY